MGAQTKYDPKYVPIVKKMCELGAIVADVAAALEVAESTVYLWQTKHPEFQEAMKIGKDPANDRVKQSLYMSACGYERNEEEIKVVNGEVVRVPVTKWYPPNPTSIVFFSCNRMSDEFSRNGTRDDNGEEAQSLNINFGVAEPVAEIKVTRGKAKD